MRIYGPGIDIDAVVAYNIEPQICLRGHVAEFLLRDDVAPLLLIQIYVVVSCCEIHTVNKEYYQIEPEEDVTVASIYVGRSVIKSEVIGPDYYRQPPEHTQKIKNL